MIEARNYAELRSIDSSYIGYTVAVAGRLVNGDGHGGMFARSDTASPDNDGTVIVDAAGRAWHRVHDSVVDPAWFGLKMQAGYDNAPAINAACAEAARAVIHMPVSGKVQLPEGVIEIHSPIDASGCDLAGGSSFDSLLWKTTAAGNGINITPYRDGIYCGPSKVRDLAVMTGAQNNTAISIYGDADYVPDNCVIRNVRISRHGGSGQWTYGIYAAGAPRTNPDGIRKITCENVEVFSNHDWAYVFSHCHGVEMLNCNSFGAQASTWNGKPRSLYAAGVQGREIYNLDIVSCKFDGHAKIQRAVHYSIDGTTAIYGDLDIVHSTVKP